MSRKGHKFEYEISRSLKEIDNTWYYKFPNLRKAKHPFDHLVITPDQNYAIEEKSTTEKSWSLSNMRDKQVSSLLWFEKMNRNSSFVFINYRHGRGKIRAFCMRIEEYLNVVDKVKENLERKSIPIDALEKHKRVEELDRVKINSSYGWNLSFIGDE